MAFFLRNLLFLSLLVTCPKGVILYAQCEELMPISHNCVDRKENEFILNITFDDHVIIYKKPDARYPESLMIYRSSAFNEKLFTADWICKSENYTISRFGYGGNYAFKVKDLRSMNTWYLIYAKSSG